MFDIQYIIKTTIITRIKREKYITKAIISESDNKQVKCACKINKLYNIKGIIKDGAKHLVIIIC